MPNFSFTPTAGRRVLLASSLLASAILPRVALAQAGITESAASRPFLSGSFASQPIAAPLRGASSVAVPTPLYLAEAEPAPVISGLPEAPEPAAYSSSSLPGDGPDGRNHTGPTKVAGPYDDTIQAGQTAPSLSSRDKFWMGIRGSVSPFAAVGWLASAAYAQASNGSPNYGQTGKGFAQRLGSAAARASSEDIFSTSILAPVLREDPRYYVMGPGHSFIRRTAYSVTRTLITKTDSGHTTVNLSLLGGNLGGSALAQVYYPPANQGGKELLATFGGSIGGSALGYFIDEFFGNAAGLIHFNRQKQTNGN